MTWIGRLGKSLSARAPVAAPMSIAAMPAAAPRVFSPFILPSCLCPSFRGAHWREPGISRFYDVQLHVGVRCCASPRNDEFDRDDGPQLFSTNDLMLRASPKIRGPHSRSICSEEKRNEGMPQFTESRSPAGSR